MATGHWVLQALYVVVECGVADLLAAGPRSSTALAEATNTDAAALYRILRTLAGVGVFAEGTDRTTPRQVMVSTGGPFGWQMTA